MTFMNYLFGNRFPLTLSVLLSLLAFTPGAMSQLPPTISTTTSEQLAYAANAGWVNFHWDTDSPGEGATVTDTFLAGSVYGANIGWIDLGDGSPENGIQYQNTEVNGQADFGVNHDGTGNLSGLAYGANIGWISFGWDTTGKSPDRPRFDLLNGRFSGLAYSGNIGWIDLGSGNTIRLITETMAFVDSDNDMLSDAWERTQVVAAGRSTGSPNLDLGLLAKESDDDNDGQTSLEEFIADTNPFDANDHLRITFFASPTALPSATSIRLSWTSPPTRVYDLKSSATDLVVGDFSTTARANMLGSSTGSSSQTYSDPLTDIRLWRIETRLPLTQP